MSPGASGGRTYTIAANAAGRSSSRSVPPPRAALLRQDQRLGQGPQLVGNQLLRQTIMHHNHASRSNYNHIRHALANRMPRTFNCVR